MKVIIFEDEKLNAERLVQLLQQIVPEIEVLNIIGSIAQGITWLTLHEQEADIAFMDIQLSDGNCFEMFEAVSLKIPVIFTTAYDKFALKAFEVHSIDYLMKPIDKNELERALGKFNYFKSKAHPILDVSKIAAAFYRQEHTRFLGRTNNQLVYVKSKDIAFLQYTAGITWAVTFSARKVPMDYSLDQMERMLNHSLFFRINRKTIINIDAISKINSYYNSRLILQLSPAPDEPSIVSRERVTVFKNWLEGRETFE